MSYAPSQPSSEGEGAAAVSGASARGSHRLEAALHCERFWTLRYQRNVVPLSHPDFLTLGTLVHTRLAYHYAAKMKTPPPWFTAQTLDAAVAADGVGRPDLIDQSQEIFDAYKLYWAAEVGTPIAVEEEFRAPLGDMVKDCPDDVRDEVVTCRVDLITVIGDQAWLVDHKTAGGRDRLPRWSENGGYDCALQMYHNLRILRAQRDWRFVTYPIAGAKINRVKRGLPYDFDAHELSLSRLAYADSGMMMVDAVRREKAVQAKVAAGERPTPNIGYHCQRCDYRAICFARDETERASVYARCFTTKGA